MFHASSNNAGCLRSPGPDATPVHITTVPKPPSSVQDLLEPILIMVLRRVSRWAVPPYWSPGDWHREAKQIAAAAGIRALSECEFTKCEALEHFVAQRMTSSIRTRHRHEWRYASHFQSTEDHSELLSEFLAIDRESSGIVEVAAEPIFSYQELHEAVSNLAILYRKVIEDIFLKGYTEAEVGIMLHLSQCAVNKRKQAGLKSLRDVLSSSA
jgi:DNA-directed RNA polymerase specialized sigma24 family protein